LRNGEQELTLPKNADEIYMRFREDLRSQFSDLYFSLGRSLTQVQSII